MRTLMLQQSFAASRGVVEFTDVTERLCVLMQVTWLVLSTAHLQHVGQSLNIFIDWLSSEALFLHCVFREGPFLFWKFICLLCAQCVSSLMMPILIVSLNSAGVKHCVHFPISGFLTKQMISHHSNPSSIMRTRSEMHVARQQYERTTVRFSCIKYELPFKSRSNSPDVARLNRSEVNTDHRWVSNVSGVYQVPSRKYPEFCSAIAVKYVDRTGCASWGCYSPGTSARRSLIDVLSVCGQFIGRIRPAWSRTLTEKRTSYPINIQEGAGAHPSFIIGTRHIETWTL